MTCVSSLNVSVNSNLNNLHVSGAAFCYGHLFPHQNVYGISFFTQFDPLVPNKSINTSTRGNGNLNLNAVGSGG
jgi:hypothetical protein